MEKENKCDDEMLKMAREKVAYHQEMLQHYQSVVRLLENPPVLKKT